MIVTFANVQGIAERSELLATINKPTMSTRTIALGDPNWSAADSSTPTSSLSASPTVSSFSITPTSTGTASNTKTDAGHIAGYGIFIFVLIFILLRGLWVCSCCTCQRRTRRAQTNPTLPTHRTVAASVQMTQTSPSQRPGSTSVLKECIVCRLQLDVPSFPKRNPTDDCTHASSICTLCLQTYVDGKDMKTFASPRAFERYDYLLTRKLLSSEPGFVWCKNSKCEAGQYHGEGGGIVVTCVDCGAKSCFRHDIPWHEGRTCEQYDKANGKQEAAAQKCIAKSTKPCPKCHAPIEKISGCDHMTCRPPGGCGYEFCWTCLTDYQSIIKNGNSHHRTECRFYAQ